MTPGQTTMPQPAAPRGWVEVKNDGGEPIARISKATHKILRVRGECASESCKGFDWLKTNVKGTVWCCDDDCAKSWKAQQAAAKYAAQRRKAGK